MKADLNNPYTRSSEKLIGTMFASDKDKCFGSAGEQPGPEATDR